MKTVVVFNMRGGIGKTTIAVTLAESLAYFCGLRVLIIDADPQRNTSLRLCERGVVDECSQARTGKNISKYLSDAVIRNELPNPKSYITEKVGTIHGQGQVDILMGSLDTIDADRHFAGRCTTQGDRSLFSDLGKAFGNLGRGTHYDVMVVDSPPALSTLVQGALCVADLLVVPMMAQSTSQLLYGSTEKQIHKHLKAIGVPVPTTLVVATMYEASNRAYFDRIREYFGSDLKIRKQKSFLDRELYSPEDGTTVKEKYGTAAPDLKAVGTVVAQRVGLRISKPTKATRKAKHMEARNVGKRRGSSSGTVARTG